MPEPEKQSPSHWPISVLTSLAALVNMALPLVLVRILTPEEVGGFKIFFLYATIVPPFSLASGLVNGLYYWAGKGQEGRAAIRLSGVLLLGAAALFAGILWVLRDLLPWVSAWPRDQTALFAVAAFAAVASVFYEESSIATGKVWRGALYNSGFELARTSIIVIVALKTGSLIAILGTHVAVALAKTLVGYLLSYRAGLFGLREAGLTAPQSIARPVLKYAVPVSFAWALGVFTNYADQFVLSTFISAREFAFYSIGCLSVPPLIILEYSVTRVLIPQLSGAFAEGDSDRAASLYKRAVDELAFLLIPAVAGMVIFATPIIELLFTREYSEAARFLPLYAISYLALTIPYDSVQRAQGKAGWILKNFAAFSFLALALCFVLTRSMGAYGALIGLLVSKAAMRGYAVYAIRSSTGWKLREFLPVQSFLRYGAISLALAVPCLTLKSAFDSDLAWFLICGTFFAALALPLQLAFKKSLPLAPHKASRILMLTQYLGIGGLERMILNLSLALKSRGGYLPQVFVFDHHAQSTDGSHMVDAFEERGLKVDTYSKPRGFSPRAVLKIRAVIKRDRISVIHSHDLGALIYGVMAKLACLGSVRLVHTQHSFVHMKRKRRYRIYERFFTQFADAISVVSEDTRKTYLSLGIPERKLALISNGVSFTSNAPADRASRIKKRAELGDAVKSIPILGDDAWILYMARLYPGKGQEHAIDLWNELPDAVRARSRLIFVGPESLDGLVSELMSKASQAKSSDRIHYAGPTHTPQHWLEASDVYLSCSEFEGMPLGPLEAAGSGLPLLLSEIEGHLLLKERYSLYPIAIPSQGAASLSSIIERIHAHAQDLEFWPMLWKESAWIRERYSLDAMAESFERLYRGGNS